MHLYNVFHSSQPTLPIIVETPKRPPYCQYRRQLRRLDENNQSSASSKKISILGRAKINYANTKSRYLTVKSLKD